MYSDRNGFLIQSTTYEYTMPILLKDHDPELALRPGTTKSDIVKYLYQHPEWGYSPKDVTEALDIPRGTATTTLKRLYDDDYLGKTDDGYYHALGDREDIRRYVSSLDQTHRLFGHHRDEETTPETPEKRIGDGRTDEELDAELDALENEMDGLDE
ncbi:MarR family transcriptional regulator [Halorubrum aquaticum]|nr:MarR family transcriptional regulator [Halorubrum aquaticum]